MFTVDVTKPYHDLCAVVPRGLTDPAVLNAIIFSTLIMSNGTLLTPECLRYKGQAIHALNGRAHPRRRWGLIQVHIAKMAKEVVLAYHANAAPYFSRTLG